MVEIKKGSPKIVSRKRETAHRRLRENLLKSQNDKQYNELKLEEVITLKHIQHQQLKFMKRKERLDAEKAWSGQKFKASEIATACRGARRASEPVQEINMRNVGSIVFQDGGFMPYEKQDKRKSVRLLDELHELRRRACAVGARPITVPTFGNILNSRSGSVESSRISLDSYLQKYLHDCHQEKSEKRNNESIACTFMKIVDTWKNKFRDGKRGRKLNPEDIDTIQHTEYEYNWQFILNLVNHLRCRDINSNLNPLSTLKCRYLRLSDSTVQNLENKSRELGYDPGIHAFSKPNTYDPFLNDIFGKSLSHLAESPVPDKLAANDTFCILSSTNQK